MSDEPDGRRQNASVSSEERPAPAGLHEEATPSQVKPLRKWVWIAALVLLAAGVFLFRDFEGGRSKNAAGSKGGGAGAQGRGSQAGPAAITVEQSTTGNIDIYVDALGTVTPLYTVTAKSRITGRVMAVHYSEGQIWKAAYPLIEIVPLAQGRDAASIAIASYVEGDGASGRVKSLDLSAALSAGGGFPGFE